MKGWVKTYRSLMEWEWYQDSKMVHLMTHLILKANHKDGFWHGYEVKRGQLITGRKKLSKETGISEQSIRTCLDRLKITKEITTAPTSKFTTITVCNYDKYQGGEKDDNQEGNQQNNQNATGDQPASNHKQECKEFKEGEEVGLFPPQGEEPPQMSIYQREIYDKLMANYPKQDDPIGAMWAVVQLNINPDQMQKILVSIHGYKEKRWDSDLRFIPSLKKFLVKRMWEVSLDYNDGEASGAFKPEPLVKISPGDTIIYDGHDCLVGEDMCIRPNGSGIVPIGMLRSMVAKDPSILKKAS